MLKKALCVIVLTMVLVLNLFAGGKIEPVEQTVNSDGYNEIITHRIKLQWKVNGDTMDIIISAPAVGWVSVGFGATTIMKDANILIGYVENDRAFIRDDFGSGNVEHRSDIVLGGTDDITNLSGTEANETTELRFTIPLDSGDKYDAVLVPGQECKIILSYSLNSDSFDFFHSDAVTVVIKI